MVKIWNTVKHDADTNCNGPQGPDEEAVWTRD